MTCDNRALRFILGEWRQPELAARNSSKDHIMFRPEVVEKLRFYVYAYLDPCNREVFYVGKGKGNRAFEHLYDVSETRKTQRIAEIKAAGREPRIDILVYGLNEDEAFRVESVCIDLIGLDRLTNLVPGHSAAWGGRQPAQQIIEQFTATRIEVTDPAIAITINQTFAYGMDAETLYESTRGIWVIARGRARQARYALAVLHGVVKEVYEIESWHPAGATQYRSRVFEPDTVREGQSSSARSPRRVSARITSGSG